MKKIWPLAFLFLIVGCATEKDKPKYLRWVGDIEADVSILQSHSIIFAKVKEIDYFYFCKPY